MCVLDFRGHICGAFPVVIQKKMHSTIVTIVCQQVDSHIVSSTDEHAHMQIFLISRLCMAPYVTNMNSNRKTRVNTQAIEPFHNEFKLEIKKEMDLKWKLW